MNVFTLLERATKRLQLQDSLYHEQCEVVLGILRSAGVLPYKRSSLNGELHKLVAAMLVNAYESDTSIDVATRKAGTFHHYGYSTKIISYLDKMVGVGLLLSQRDTAKGKLVLSDLLEDYLGEVELTLA